MTVERPVAANDELNRDIDERIEALLQAMTLAEKIGQMSQVNAPDGHLPADFLEALRAGRIGSVLNSVDVNLNNELQRVAVEETRLGIPLLVGRDVIHGFNTVFPIPLGQAATWNRELVRECARHAAAEAARTGVNWTFAPMIDVTRDPRWGRIAESPGEDTFLASELAAAMVQGFQGEALSEVGSIAACAKHYAGYGASESGRDYNTTLIPENELRNVHLPPFQAAADAGCATFMASFSDLNGIPATGNEFLMRQVLRDEWGFDGFVVSDWDSIRHLSVHGLTDDDRGSAEAASLAGVDMEMASHTYRDHLASLVNDGRVDVSIIDEAVRNILRVKFRLGLFDSAQTDPERLPPVAEAPVLASAREAALQSIVLLQNHREVLPLDANALSTVAVIGPLANAPYEQLGTWIFDGEPSLSVTPLTAICDELDGLADVRYARGTDTTRSRTTDGFERALEVARDADVVLMFLGEESILSGEAHCRANIDLPGNQAELVREVRALGNPIVAVIMAGRPLTLANIIDEVDAVLFAWHPGSQGGPAIADLLFGIECPSGKLPVTFPRMVGQVPIYYSHRNTGKPPSPQEIIHMDDIPPFAAQTSHGMTSFFLDAGHTPQFPFGHGLSYTRFDYSDLELIAAEIVPGESMDVAVTVTNVGERPGEEVVQLYVRDLVGSITRPVRELKGFTRVRLDPGASQRITFSLATEDLGFYGRHMNFVTEPGRFHLWIGGSSTAELCAEFRIVDA